MNLRFLLTASGSRQPSSTRQCVAPCDCKRPCTTTLHILSNEMCAHNVNEVPFPRGSPPLAPKHDFAWCGEIYLVLCIPFTPFTLLSPRQLGQLAPSLLPVQPLVFLRKRKFRALKRISKKGCEFAVSRSAKKKFTAREKKMDEERRDDAHSSFTSLHLHLSTSMPPSLLHQERDSKGPRRRHRRHRLPRVGGPGSYRSTELRSPSSSFMPTAAYSLPSSTTTAKWHRAVDMQRWHKVNDTPSQSAPPPPTRSWRDRTARPS